MENQLKKKVSILVAARNEEKNIANCIMAIMNQDFPVEDFEVWIGNDGSVDRTEAIVTEFSKIHPNLHLLNIQGKIKGLLGKANVLAQLANCAKGDFFLITDADVLIPRTWISEYLKHFQKPADMLSGVVALKTNTVFGKLQNADWLNYMASCAIKSDQGNPVTAVGCNMAIRSDTYRAIGGYENIPFSITEDYELFKAVNNGGYTFKSLLSKEILAFTNPVDSFSDLLRQRKRWLTGSFRKNWRFTLGFNLSCLFLPFLILLLFIYPLIAGIIFLIRWLKDIIFLSKIYKQLKIQPNIGLYLYTPYQVFCNFTFITFQFSPASVEWKGRKY